MAIRNDECGARSLVWIRHQPSELDVPGSNPGAPAKLVHCISMVKYISIHRLPSKCSSM